MPDHGFDAPPTQVLPQDTADEFDQSFHQWQQQEHEDRHRKETAETSMIDAAVILQKLDKKLDAEREQRKLSDDINMKCTIRWNRINLAVGAISIAVGVAGVIVAVISLHR